MNFDLSPEARGLRDEVRRFLGRRVSPSLLRAVAEDGRTHDMALWSEIAALGWPAVAAPMELGGVGMGYEGLCVVAEQAGASLAPAPIVSAFGAIEALLIAGDPDQQSRWIPLLASGEKVGVVAIAEGPGAPRQAAIGAEVVGSALTGAKAPVADGMLADVFVVVARQGSDTGLYLVEATASGVSRSPAATLDLGRSQAELVFDAAAAERLGDGGWPCIERLIDRLAIIAAFEQLGGASACLAMAIAQARQRIAFGRPIGSFQAIKHRLADLFVAVELARSNAYFGAWALEHGRDEIRAAASARLSATHAYDLAARTNIHVHGGQGVTWEADCHLYFRRSRMLAAALGAPAHWKERLIDHLQANPDAG